MHLRVRGRTTIVAGYSVSGAPDQGAPAWRSRAYVPASAVVFDKYSRSRNVTERDVPRNTRHRRAFIGLSRR